MTVAPGYSFVRHSSRVRPIDIAPWMFDMGQEPQMRQMARVKHKQQVAKMNDSNPRYANYQTHLQRLALEAEVCQHAMLTLLKYRHGKAITQSDFEWLEAAAMTMFNTNFERIIPIDLLAKVAKKVVLEQEVIN